MATGMRILAIDPGEKRIGLAISDPSGTIANPLVIIHHISRSVDAAVIAKTAQDQGAELIVVGQALDEENQPTFQSRKANRLATAIRQQTRIPVVLWDETNSTKIAGSARREMGVTRAKRREQRDDLAATVILQTYLDAHYKE